MTRKVLTVIFFTVFLLGIATRSEAIPINGIEFPDGYVSFADSVVSYTQGVTGGVDATHSDPENALQAPDYTGNNSEPTFVSLGDGGTLILEFTDNYLTTSGDNTDDLWIFEIGGAVEATDVYISTSLEESWISVGRVGGATKGVDLDSFGEVTLGGAYYFVMLIDVPPCDSEDPFCVPDAPSAWPWTGADIDAVGAISTVATDPDPEPDPDPDPDPTSVPEPSTMLLLLAGLFMFGLFRAKFGEAKA